MSWKLSFQHGWLPAMANHATVGTEDRWKKHTFTQKCLKWMEQSNVKNMLHSVWLSHSVLVVISWFKLCSLCYKMLTKGLYFMIQHSSKSISGENVKFLQKVLKEWMSFSTSVHLYHSWLSAICSCWCTIVIHKAVGCTQMLRTTSNVSILQTLQLGFRAEVK